MTHPSPTPLGLAPRDYDYVGASHVALLEMLTYPHLDPTAFLNVLISVIQDHGATHNQRALLSGAFTRATQAGGQEKA